MALPVFVLPLLQLAVSERAFWDERTLRLPPEAAQLRLTEQCDGQLTFLGPKLVLTTALGGLVCVSLVFVLPTRHLAVLWGGRRRVLVRSQWFLWSLGVRDGCLRCTGAGGSWL